MPQLVLGPAGLKLSIMTDEVKATLFDIVDSKTLIVPKPKAASPPPILPAWLPSIVTRVRLVTAVTPKVRIAPPAAPASLLIKAESKISTRESELDKPPPLPSAELFSTVEPFIVSVAPPLTIIAPPELSPGSRPLRIMTSLTITIGDVPVTSSARLPLAFRVEPLPLIMMLLTTCIVAPSV